MFYFYAFGMMDFISDQPLGVLDKMLVGSELGEFGKIVKAGKLEEVPKDRIGTTPKKEEVCFKIPGYLTSGIGHPSGLAQGYPIGPNAKIRKDDLVWNGNAWITISARRNSKPKKGEIWIRTKKLSTLATELALKLYSDPRIFIATQGINYWSVITDPAKKYDPFHGREIKKGRATTAELFNSDYMCTIMGHNDVYRLSEAGRIYVNLHALFESISERQKGAVTL